MRIGIIGCGEIGSLRAAAVKRLPGWDLRAVTDLQPSSANSVSRRFGAKIEAHWKSLVARDDLDAILVCTPPNLHLEMCSAALQAGKHVLCEKPLARSSEECHQILKVAETSGRFLATGFNYRFFPSVQKARAILDSNIIGTVEYMTSYAGYSADDHSHAWIRDANVVGGGALRDNGIHLIDLTRYFLGEVTEACGLTTNSTRKYEDCEDNGFLLMRNQSGKIAALHASWTEWKKYKFCIEISASRGCINVSCFPMLTHVYWQTSSGATQQKRYWFPAIQVMEHIRSYRWVTVQSFVEELRAFSEAITGHPSKVATGYDGLRAVEIAEAAGRSLLIK